MKFKINQANPFVATLLAAILAMGCSSDIEDPVNNGTGGTSGSGTSGSTSGSDGGTSIPDTNGTYSLSLSNSTVSLAEGTDLSITVQIERSDGYDRPVTLAIEGVSAGDLDSLGRQFSNTRLEGNANSATITISMGFSALPIQRQTRALRIIGTDGVNQRVAALNLDIVPTSLPDVYLLIGQSNMVGFSELNAKQVFAGGADATDNRIQQLNVTGNDQENFKSASSFINDDAIAVPSPRLTIAVDPLHDGFDSRVNGKEGSRVGLGLSFAKRAIANTQASIFLVPAAWSDTGFCRRERAAFEGQLGWNATPSSNPALSGTLLHDRAIARANLALRESGGILRGILWHQGEADSDELDCAVLYENNLKALVRSLRSNIIQDPRGASARGPEANIPFIVGTMSKGGVYDELTEPKLIVDGVHRNIKQIVKFSAFVNSDDLVPPDYPCGEGDCIHFGSTAYRQMGSRYYDFLLEAAAGQ